MTDQDLVLQTFFTRTQGFFWVSAEELQDEEGQQDQGKMGDMRSIDAALASQKTTELFGVAEKSFYRPAGAFAVDDQRQIIGQIVGSQHQEIAMTVSGHDQSQGAIGGQVSGEAARPPGEGGTPFQLERSGQLPGLPEAMVVANLGLAFQHAHPGPAQPGDGFGQPTGGVEVIKGDIVDLKAGLRHFQDHLSGQFSAFAVLSRGTVLFWPPQAKCDRNAPGANAKQQHHHAHPFDRTFLAGRLQVSDPGAFFAIRLLQNDLVDHQIPPPQPFGPPDHLTEQTACGDPMPG